MIDDQLQALRDVIVDGLNQGRHARRIGLDLVGRINRATGRREGGLIGLSSRQIDDVRSARAILSSGNPTEMRKFLKRPLRDKRLDRIVTTAIRDGRPVNQANIDRLMTGYTNKLLKHRGRVIARSETLAATHAGHREGFQQLIDTGAVREQQVRKIWRATGDDRVRDSHTRLDSESVGFNEPFISPATGAHLMHPGDTSRGAPGEDVIQCRCWMETRIDFLGNL